ncbi:MAG TPA: shikimate kinase, partial [Pyrinomonadaceae bacterium]|nr:shikimate kinase [Pyrinomonadaceae bacterium]
MSAPQQPIIITGFMGAGKTTVALALAERLGCGMIDLDQFIEQREGRTIKLIIDEDGEARFRELESGALRDALEIDGAQIIALGGGTWTIERNRALIHEHHGHTIWLDAPFELCWQRIASQDNSRPLARDKAQTYEFYKSRCTLYA